MCARLGQVRGVLDEGRSPAPRLLRTDRYQSTPRLAVMPLRADRTFRRPHPGPAGKANGEKEMGGKLELMGTPCVELAAIHPV